MDLHANRSVPANQRSQVGADVPAKEYIKASVFRFRRPAGQLEIVGYLSNTSEVRRFVMPSLRSERKNATAALNIAGSSLSAARSGVMTA